METIVLEQYIQYAEKAFEQNDYPEGLKYLQQALAIEPCYGKTHNHLGWLYLFKLNDWEKAERHLNMALKHAPGYSAPYIHYSYLLFERGRFEEADELLERALTIGGIQKSFVWNEYGRIQEIKGRFRKAVSFYKLAIRWSLNDQDLEVYKENIRRCRKKRWVLMF